MLTQPARRGSLDQAIVVAAFECAAEHGAWRHRTVLLALNYVVLAMSVCVRSKILSYFTT